MRNSVADKREADYQRARIQDYQFRVGPDLVLDATKKGSVARFINHSCDPNCYAVIKTTPQDGRRHIIIVSKRLILMDEEITYDYQFPLEDEKIPCLCGAACCRLFLN